METDVVTDAWLVAICVAYVAIAWLLQMHTVTTPRDWLLGRMMDVRARIVSEGWAAGTPAQQNLERMERALGKGWWRLSTSAVQAGWRHVHGLEDAHILELPTDIVDEQLRSLKTRLASMRDSQSKDLAERIGRSLEAPPDLASRRALLREASIHRHGLGDTNHEDLASLLAKAVFLTAMALALVAGLGVLFDRKGYFLLGAAGALISRLTRVLRHRPRASDYGAVWSTLLLSPAAGALAGWLGVMIVAVLAGDPFRVLGEAFAAPWDHPYEPLGFLVAFVAGFSERWFDRLVGAAGSTLVGTLPGETRDPAREGTTS